MQAALESPPCPLCDAPEHNLSYRERFAPYGIAQCTACSFEFLSPRLSEPAMLERYRDPRYYAGQDGDVGYSDYAAQEPALRLTFRRLIRELSRRGLQGGRLLEVGCGRGYLLSEAKAAFDSVEGIELSAEAAAEASKHATVYVGDVSAAPRDATYDFIIATQVIEHAYRPRAFVAELVTRLRSGGRLLLATPDAGSFWRACMRWRWPSYKLPEHVLYFDKASLSRLLSGAGLTAIDEIPYPHAFPLSLVAAKFGVRLPGGLGRPALWLPKTTVALVGTKA